MTVETDRDQDKHNGCRSRMKCKQRGRDRGKETIKETDSVSEDPSITHSVEPHLWLSYSLSCHMAVRPLPKKILQASSLSACITVITE